MVVDEGAAPAEQVAEGPVFHVTVVQTVADTHDEVMGIRLVEPATRPSVARR